MSAAARPHTRKRTGSRPGWVRALGGVVLLVAALLVVPWRHTRGLNAEQALRELETERAMAEAERVELVRQIEQLRSRSRIVRVARERLGMHLPADGEIVFLPVEAPLSDSIAEARP